MLAGLATLLTAGVLAIAIAGAAANSVPSICSNEGNTPLCALLAALSERGVAVALGAETVSAIMAA